MTVTFQVEPLTGKLAGEVESIAEAHGREYSYWKEQKGPVDIDWAYFFASARAGTFAAITARDDGRLVGYFGYEIGRLLHYKTILQVRDDTYYLLPEYRKTIVGFRFMAFAVEQMEKSKAKIIKVVDKVKDDHARLWEKLGFTAEEIHYTKVNPNG